MFLQLKFQNLGQLYDELCKNFTKKLLKKRGEKPHEVDISNVSKKLI